MLDIENLTVAFRTESGEATAIEDVSLSIRPGEILGVVGESGSGKSVTALGVMGLLPEPAARVVSGRVVFEGQVLTGLSEPRLRRIRGPGIGMVFQEPMTSLNPVFSIGEQITETLAAHGERDARKRRDRAVEMLERVGIPSAAQRLNDYPHQLSGGQRQRVGIAMALACRPRLLIADEPTTALDVTIQAGILDLVLDLREQLGMAVLLITHNMGVIAEVADRVAVMYAGRIVEQSPVDRLFEAPAHPYTNALLGCVPALEDDRPRLASIPGNLPDPKNRPPGCRFAPRCPKVTPECNAAIPPMAAPPMVAIGENHQAACIHPTSQILLPPEKTSSAHPPTLSTKAAFQTDLLTVDALTKHYEINARRLFASPTLLRAVDGVSLAIPPGATLGLVGESGCGKSTLGRLLIRLIPPTAGRVAFDGQDITALHGAALKQARRAIGVVFQDPYGALDPRMTVDSIIREPLLIHGERPSKTTVSAMLDRVGLPASAATRYPHEFSGGQRQRIGIARALILKPRFLVCDEPVSALDVSVQAGIVNLLQDLQTELGVAILFIAHDLGVVRHISDRVAVMYLGRVVEEADKHALYARPMHPYTQALIASVPALSPTGRAERRAKRARVGGDIPSAMAIPSGCRFHTRCPQVMPICREVDPALTPQQPGHTVACHLYPS